MKVKTGFFLLLALLFSYSVQAKNSLQLKDLEQLLGGFKSFNAEYQQITRDEKGFLVQQLSGSLILQKPSQFFWRSDEPYAQQLISDGKTIWHYDEDLEQLVIQQYQSQIEQAPILLILEKPSSLAENFLLINTDETKGLQQFDLKPNNQQLALEQISLFFKGQRLVRLAFIDTIKQTTTI